MVDRIFGSVDEAMAAKRRGVLLYVRVGGVAVPASEAHIVHDTDAGIGQAAVYLPKPVPASLALNATLEIEIGQPGTVRRRFFGFIPAYSRAISDRGFAIRVSAVGWLSYLNYPDPDGTSIVGPASLKDVFRSLAYGRAVPTSKSDDTRYVNGDTIMLGGNEAVDGGDIRFGSDTSPNTFLQQVAPLFGYRVHDAPDGELKQSRVSGIPIPQHTVGLPSLDYTPGDWFTPIVAVSVRSTVELSTTILGVLSPGQLAYVVDGPVVNNNLVADNHWYYVRVLNGPTGWVATRRTGTGLANAYDVTLDEPLYWFTEGENLRELTWDIDRTPIVTYVEVVGKSYTELDGGKNQIRSIPQEVEANEYIAPAAFVHKKFTSQWIVTAEQAEGCRNAYEVDLSAPAEEFTWKAGGRSDIQPGEIAVLNATTYPISNRTVWLRRIADDVTKRTGWVQTYRGSAGGGEALPAGDDCIYQTIGSGVYHVGNQNLSWYADPTPDGTEITINISITETDFSSCRIEGEAHGSNTYGEKTASTGSVIELWQKPDPNAAEGSENEWRRVGSVELPTLWEEVSKRRPYGSESRWWTAFSLPISGTMKLGAARLKLIAGENPDGFDDYEVRNLRFKTCGVGQPILPGTGS